MKIRTFAGGVVALVVTWGAFASASPTAGAETAPTDTTSQVTVVHGLRGQVVDVYLDGTRLLESFQPDRLTDPMTVTAGKHHLDLRSGGSDPASTPKASIDLPIPANQNLAVVAHYGADGQSWAVTVYSNDVPVAGAGAGAVVFRNDAAGSPVDIAVDGATLVNALVSPGESRQSLGEGVRSVSVNTTGAGVLVPANDVTVATDGVTYLYLVGSGTGVTWLSQRVEAARVAPARISTGNSGLADPDRHDTDVPWQVAAAAAVVVGGTIAAIRRGRAGAILNAG